MDRDEVPVKCEQVHKDIGDKQSKTKVGWKHRTARRRENRTVSVCESMRSLGEGGMLARGEWETCTGHSTRVLSFLSALYSVCIDHT